MPRKSPPVAPTCFVPSCPADFAGQVGKIAQGLMLKADLLSALCQRFGRFTPAR